MFSGRVMLSPDPFDGTYFVDRSPAFFPLIIYYLRTGKVKDLKKMDKVYKSGFVKEAEFYGLEGLIELLGGKRKRATGGSSTFEYDHDWDENGLFRYFKDNEIEAPNFILVTNSSSSSNHYTIDSNGSCVYNVPQEKAREICGFDVAWTLVSPTTTGQNFVSLDLGEDYSFHVTDAVFSCKYSPSSYFNHPNVHFSGSNDNVAWTLIGTVKLGHNSFEHEESYRYFKVDNVSSQTLISGWEMYGSLD